MKAAALLCAIVGWGLTCSVAGAAQERGNWRAASETARSITGDVAFSNDKISIDFSSFPIAQIRRLQPAEVSAAFDLQSGATGSGNLYRLDVPATKKFLRHNTLCGSEDAEWVATYVVGRELQLAFFSGPAMPVFTPEAISTSSNLCGTYSYVR